MTIKEKKRLRNLSNVKIQHYFIYFDMHHSNIGLEHNDLEMRSAFIMFMSSYDIIPKFDKNRYM